MRDQVDAGKGLEEAGAPQTRDLSLDRSSARSPPRLPLSDRQMESRLASTCMQVPGAAPTATGRQRRQLALAYGFAGLVQRNVWRGEFRAF